MLTLISLSGIYIFMFFDCCSCCPPEINPASLYTELLLFAEYGNSDLEGGEEIASASTKVRQTHESVVSRRE